MNERREREGDEGRGMREAAGGKGKRARLVDEVRQLRRDLLHQVVHVVRRRAAARVRRRVRSRVRSLRVVRSLGDVEAEDGRHHRGGEADRLEHLVVRRHRHHVALVVLVLQLEVLDAEAEGLGRALLHALEGEVRHVGGEAANVRAVGNFHDQGGHRSWLFCLWVFARPGRLLMRPAAGTGARWVSRE